MHCSTYPAVSNYSITYVSKEALKTALHRTIPLTVRKRLAVGVHRCRWLPERRREWWSQQLISDFADVDVNAYHKFLWANHMAYARTYDVAQRFGEDRINETRKIFLRELEHVLIDGQTDPALDVNSVFDVGCSLGYLLRYVENGLFSEAEKLAGIDIDVQAIAEGQSYLERSGSKVRIGAADMEDLARVLGNDRYDVFFCTGVLMYLEESKAAEVVRVILDHTAVVAAFAGLAHPEVDNSAMEHSAVRHEDGSFIHNIDAMVARAGGRVIARRWEGSRVVDGNTIYFVFARRTTG
jgi:2-polyprenyl-3-methyl-5-hydroxy-6-metoxy-1,4-benzoquinol methylase